MTTAVSTAKDTVARETTDNFFALGGHRSLYSSRESRTNLIRPADLPAPTNDLAGDVLDGTCLLPQTVLNCYGDLVPLNELTQPAMQYLAFLFVSDFSLATSNGLSTASPRVRRRARMAELKAPPKSPASLAEAAESEQFCNHLVRCLGGGPGCKARGMQIIAVSCGLSWDPGTAQTRNCLDTQRNNGKDMDGFTELIRQLRCFGVPAELSGIRDDLRRMYQVERLPCFVIIRKQDGFVVNSNACPWIVRDPHGNSFPWSMCEDVIDSVEPVMGGNVSSTAASLLFSSLSSSSEKKKSYEDVSPGHCRQMNQQELKGKVKRAANNGIKTTQASAEVPSRYPFNAEHGAATRSDFSGARDKNELYLKYNANQSSTTTGDSEVYAPPSVMVVRANNSGNTMMGLKTGKELVAHERFELKEESLKKLSSIFHLLDKDMDGKLDEEQLLTAFVAVGIRPTRRIKYELAKRLPKKSSGKTVGIGFDMFARIIRSTLIAQPTAVTEIDALTELYETKDRPGVIKGHELRHLLTGVQTSSHTELSSGETHFLFSQLGIEDNSDVRLHEYVDDVGGDLIRVVEHRRLGDQGARSWMVKNNNNKKVRSLTSGN